MKKLLLLLVLLSAGFMYQSASAQPKEVNTSGSSAQNVHRHHRHHHGKHAHGGHKHAVAFRDPR